MKQKNFIIEGSTRWELDGELILLGANLSVASSIHVGDSSNFLWVYIQNLELEFFTSTESAARTHDSQALSSLHTTGAYHIFDISICVFDVQTVPSARVTTSSAESVWVVNLPNESVLSWDKNWRTHERKSVGTKYSRSSVDTHSGSHSWTWTRFFTSDLDIVVKVCTNVQLEWSEALEAATSSTTRHLTNISDIFDNLSLRVDCGHVVHILALTKTRADALLEIVSLFNQ